MKTGTLIFFTKWNTIDGLLSRVDREEACIGRFSLHFIVRLIFPVIRWRPAIDWEAAKASVLSVLRKRRGTEEDFLTNEDIRGITHLNRFQVLRLMHELMDENLQVKSVGKGRWTSRLYQNNDH